MLIRKKTPSEIAEDWAAVRRMLKLYRYLALVLALAVFWLTGYATGYYYGAEEIITKYGNKEQAPKTLSSSVIR